MQPLQDPITHPLDAAVDEALRAYPLTPAPQTLAPAVMTRIRTLSPAPRFRMGWLDYALSLFAAVMVGLALLGLVTLLSSPSAALARLQFSVWMQSVSVFPFALPALAGGLACAALAFVATALLFTRPPPGVSR
jgi:hypothetical protein